MNKPAELKLETVPAWIGGKPLASAARSGEVFNPATGQVTKKVVFADSAMIDAAVKAAAAAFPEWRDTPPLRRARIMQEFLALLKKNQKQLAAIVTDEHGKVLADAMGSVQRGIEYLLATQEADGNWQEEQFTGTGFPKVFYLKYHLYRLYFPLMALARYKSCLADPSSRSAGRRAGRTAPRTLIQVPARQDA